MVGLVLAQSLLDWWVRHAREVAVPTVVWSPPVVSVSGTALG
ncbi:hypothetical protein [Plantactinospora veratri]